LTNNCQIWYDSLSQEGRIDGDIPKIQESFFHISIWSVDLFLELFAKMMPQRWLGCEIKLFNRWCKLGWLASMTLLCMLVSAEYGKMSGSFENWWNLVPTEWPNFNNPAVNY